MLEHNGLDPAGISVDLDDLWAYLQSAGDPSWNDYPSFLEVAVPRILETFEYLAIHATFFVVGRDAERSKIRPLIQAISDHGHEIASHSWAHALDFGRYGACDLCNDFDRAENALDEFIRNGERGFRAPSFAFSEGAAIQLAERGYLYDSSTFPVSIGPLIRAYEALRFENRHPGKDRSRYGGFSAARLPLQPFAWRTPVAQVLELPVSTLPLVRLPFHWTYLFYLAGYSVRLAKAYLGLALRLFRQTGGCPVLLLHAADFLGSDDPLAPRFLPGMSLNYPEKRALLHQTLRQCQAVYSLSTLSSIAKSSACIGELPLKSFSRPS